MKYKIHQILSRLCAFTLAFSLFTADGFALIKEVNVWGAQSINDQGFSDNRTSMEELRADYSGFVQTDGLREYFHVDQEDPAKTDLSEALSWLIDHEIISRDETVTVTGVAAGQIPKVSISKMDVAELAGYYVNRSDMIMYLYKAVYGPVDARTIGVEVENIRTDNGKRDTLLNIMKAHNYMTEPNTEIADGIFQFLEPGAGGSPGSGNGGAGGKGGSANNIVTAYVNDSSNWRYTPQGDEYDSMFGDTNIFISQNTFTQTANGGSGGNGGDGGDGYDGGVGGTGGEGGKGGDAENSIDYETDYKQIYYVPGADMMFYRTNDVLEVYLKSALSKGLLNDERALRTDLFTETFIENQSINNGNLPSWSPAATPVVPNRTKTKLIRVTPTESVSTDKVLGVNYNVSWSGNTLQLNRVNMFSSNSGYFSTERLFKMDIYRYIYRFIVANEKKLSDLETDIVNYKYGMELDGTAPEEDVAIIKYLIAKGILNFDSTLDFVNLYVPITYDVFIPLLYRVANPNARLDFSKIQLTDSDQQWKARGYAPQTMFVTSGSSAGLIEFKYTHEGLLNNHGTGDEEDGNYTDEVLEAAASNVHYSAPGTDGRRVSGSDLLALIETKDLGNGEKKVMLGAGDVVAEATVCSDAGELVISGFNFNFKGAAATHNSGSSEYVARVLQNYLNGILQMNTTQLGSDCGTFKHGNAASECMFYFCNNLFIITLLQAHSGAYNDCIKAFDDVLDSDTFKGNTLTLQRLNQKEIISRLKNRLQSNVAGTSAPKAVKFLAKSGNGGTVTWNNATQGSQNGSAIERITFLGNNVIGIEFAVADSQGNSSTFHIERTLISDAGTATVVTGDSLDEIIASANSVQLELVQDVSAEDLSSRSEAEILRAFSATISSASLENAVNNGSSVQQFANAVGRDGFISWNTIQNYNNSCTEEIDKIPISQVSDLVLYNTQTDTYAYFSTADGKKIALVGTEVVSGDDTLGVAFKAVDNGMETCYYHINAIRLLMNAKQESAVLSGNRNLCLASQSVQENLQTVKLESETGHSEGGLVGFKALISSNDARDSAGLPADSCYFGLDPEANTRWGNYLSLSQANRTMNIIARRITFTRTQDKQKGVVYAVVTFDPVPMSDIGSASVSKETSLQDLLDSPGLVPDTEQGKELYEQNKQLCNLYANWIYGTTNQTYIETGYLKPTAYLYSEVAEVLEQMPITVFDPIPQEYAQKIKVVTLKHIDTGAVCKLGGNVAPLTPTEAQAAPEYKASYFVSNDYRILVTGDRVYINDKCLTGLSSYRGPNGDLVYRATNNQMAGSSFTVGSSFRFNGLVGDDDPSALVTKTADDGTVTCQVGPIKGLPLLYNNRAAIINYDAMRVNANYTLKQLDLTNSANNQLISIRRELKDKYPNIIVGDIIAEPVITASKDLQYVFTGKQLNTYADGDTKITGVSRLPEVGADNTVAETYAYITRELQRNSSGDVTKTFTYIQIEFSAFNYTVKNGVLVRDQAHATDFISPSLFTNLNDLIIDEMMNIESGAIPINQIPAGSLLSVGSGYYCAVGNSEDVKAFVGYSYLNDARNGIYAPQVQHAAESFSGHFVRGGNQYINVCHYFKDFVVLGGPTDEEQKALQTVSTNTFNVSNNPKYSVNANNTKTLIYEGDKTLSGTVYAPCRIAFNDMLYAYLVSSPDAAVQKYKIVSHAENAVAGSFENLPFFTSAVLESTLPDITSNIVVGGYTEFEGFRLLMEDLRRDFQKAFAGDLFTLARMIVFIILVWLVVASWICYGFYQGRLMPIIDAIKHPTNGGPGKGIDLLKVISLGTISVDTEFKLGRFIEYNIILAVLLCIVWKTGSIVF